MAFKVFFENVLPPTEVLRHSLSLSRKYHTAIEHEVLGKSQQGHDIDSFRFGSGKKAVLFYGFPDPGEALGGTLILNILKNLAEGRIEVNDWDLSWWFIPVLNFDDQPDSGKSLRTVMRDDQIREVDWCLDNPRAETLALLNLADRVKPEFTFALHDEYHS